jgi:AAA+ superfamily predicted ATPase
VDQKLTSLLKLAQKSNAIVLIDEADVFLAKRVQSSNGNYNHNGLVSVFLKHLEYFPGVMFLTTNLETEFDDAVDSRIQIKLQYEQLNTESRAKIWETHLSEARVQSDWDVGTCIELAEKYPDLNGREIKNLVLVSSALCRQRNKMLSEEVIGLAYGSRHREKSKALVAIK